MNISAVTMRRLMDGMEALLVPMPETPEQARERKDAFYTGAVALQSLDDLGVAPWNQIALSAMYELEKRLVRCKQLLEGKDVRQ